MEREKYEDLSSPDSGDTATGSSATAHQGHHEVQQNGFPFAKTRDDQQHFHHDNGNRDDEDLVKAPRKPNRLEKLIAKLGLDAGTIIMMFKGSLPPIIGIAMFQADAVADHFSTIGYLIPIVSVFALGLLPRGKFLMNLLLNLVALCFASALSILALWSAVQARIHTTPPGSTARYNSSQSAVCAVWLFFGTWIANVARANRPQLNLPVIMYSTMFNIATTNGPFMTSTEYARGFVKNMLSAMLVGLALATAVNLVVFPMSSRLVVFKEFQAGIGLLRKTLALQKVYLTRIESEDMFAVPTRTDTFDRRERKKMAKQGKTPRITKEAKAARALAETAAKLRELSGKIHADLPFAKRDFAWGKLDAKDLTEMFALFRNVHIPIVTADRPLQSLLEVHSHFTRAAGSLLTLSASQGMTTIVDIFRRVSTQQGWELGEGADDDLIAEKDIEKRVWNGVMRQMHEPFEILSKAIDLGLEHAGICLGLLPAPKRKTKTGKAANIDIEARGEELRPGDPGFAKVVHELVGAFCSKKGELLKAWVKERGLANEEEDRERPNSKRQSEKKERDRAQLSILLYMEKLMHASGEAVLDLVAFADRKVEDGTMSRKRIILPTSRRLKKWILGAFTSSEDSSAEQAAGLTEASNIVYFGDGYNHKKDPEHLPPATAWERFSHGLRVISAFFGSEEAAFGFRCACATMTIGIVAFLESTQVFFQQQRLVWAMIIVALGMTMTSGQSFFGFMCRIGGTIVAMVGSLVIWYIVAERVPGAIVMLWFFIFLNYYFFLKYPRFIPAVMIVTVTEVLIVGYELQVLKIGEERSEQSGQPVYPIYLLSPYRLACIAGGSLVAFFWTIFPSPLTDRTWLRRDLSATLYLVANYFSVINATLHSKLDESAGDVNVKGTPAHQLNKSGRRIFGKVMMLIPSMSQHSEWQKWEPTIGGKFPQEAYDEIILRSTRMMGYLTLMNYTLTNTAPGLPDQVLQVGADLWTRPTSPNSRPISFLNSDNQAWLDALADVLITLGPTNHTILSTLTLLSNSLLSGQSLPPFLALPRPSETTRQLEKIRPDRHRRRGGSEDSESDSSAYSSSDDDSEDDEIPIRMVDSRTGFDTRNYDNEVLRRRSTLRRDSRRDSRRRASQPTTGRSAAISYHHHRLGLSEGMIGSTASFGSMDRMAGMETVLDVRHMEQPGYAEFAVLRVCTTLVIDDLEGLVRAVSGLVGVVDFSYRVNRSGVRARPAGGTGARERLGLKKPAPGGSGNADAGNSSGGVGEGVKGKGRVS